MRSRSVFSFPHVVRIGGLRPCARPAPHRPLPPACGPWDGRSAGDRVGPACCPCTPTCRPQVLSSALSSGREGTPLRVPGPPQALNSVLSTREPGRGLQASSQAGDRLVRAGRAGAGAPRGDGHWRADIVPSFACSLPVLPRFQALRIAHISPVLPFGFCLLRLRVCPAVQSAELCGKRHPSPVTVTQGRGHQGSMGTCLRD